MMSNIRKALGVGALMTIAAACLNGPVGCAGGMGSTTNDASSSGNSSAAASAPGASETRQQSDLYPFGALPFDSVTMPLSSPDGLHVATQTGRLIDPMVRKGFWTQTVPVGVRVELFDLIATSESSVDPNSRSELRRRMIVGDGLLLGRSANPDGFIVEAPQEDGSRWIGIVSWQTGSVEWLVMDNQVNAHAAIGPQGQLAWCRRRPQEKDFELVIRIDGNEWQFRDAELSWLMPTWSATGEGLFAFRAHEDGLIQAWYLSGRTELEMSRARKPVGLTKAGTLEMAVDLVRAQPAVVGIPAPMEPVLIFQNPEVDGVAVWRPFRRGVLEYAQVELGSTAAALHESGLVMYTGVDGTAVTMLDSNRVTNQITRQIALPYLTSDKRWPFLLFAPRGPGSRELFVTGMNPMPKLANATTE